jgi:hypothetical protein
MIEEPKCLQRRCEHFQGVRWLGEEESSERPVCKAFPDGIPDEIAFGDNLHLQPFKGDHGVQYEMDKGVA